MSKVKQAVWTAARSAASKHDRVCLERQLNNVQELIAASESSEMAEEMRRVQAFIQGAIAALS